MQNLTSSTYFTEVSKTANYIVTLAIESLELDNEEINEENLNDRIQDHILYEQIDSHEYNIYYCYHLPIIMFSTNPDYCVDNFGSDFLIEDLKKGIQSLHNTLAYWAFYADVSDLIGDEIQDALSSIEDQEEGL